MECITLTSDPGVIDHGCCMHPLRKDEEKTCESIVRSTPGSCITPMPNHRIDQSTGRMSGFAFSCPSSSPILSLPMGRSMFYGHTACECEVTDIHARQASTSDIISLLSDVSSARETMKGFLRWVRERAKEVGVATFECRPDNVEGVSRDGAGGGRGHIRSKRMIDSKDWAPEVPDMIGIYHSFVRGHNRDTRVHKLFIIVTGGCCKASDEFYNMVLDCHGHATAKDCAMSEEAWWLRRASHRSRCRLIAECAEAFGLRVNNIRDIQSFSSAAPSMHSRPPSCASAAPSVASSAFGGMGGGVRIAVPTIDTVTHDMCTTTSVLGTRDDTVHIFDSCTDISCIRNGFLCSMHPSEGYWIFKGENNRAIGGNSYGMGWTPPRSGDMSAGILGSQYASWHIGMPTSVIRAPTPMDRENSKGVHYAHATVCTSDSRSIVRINPVEDVDPSPEVECVYQFFDEQYMSLVAKEMGWPRDKGVVELIPVVLKKGYPKEVCASTPPTWCTTMSTPEHKHTFVNHLVSLLEDMDRWEQDDEVDKSEMATNIRTVVLKCMRAGMVHPFTTFYSLEASTVISRAADQAS